MPESRSIVFSTLILDFDGVILESTGIKTQAFMEMFRDYPEHHHEIVKYHQKHLGMSRYKKFSWIYSQLLEQPLSESGLRELGTRYSEIVVDKILQTPFVPGALETLASCANANVPVFVISGTPHEELLDILARRELQRYVTAAWGSPTEKTTAIQEIRATYGHLTNEMLFVGDGFFDYQAAMSESVPFIARESGGESIDWGSWGIPNVPDLTYFAPIGPGRIITIPGSSRNVPDVTLSIAPSRP